MNHWIPEEEQNRSPYGRSPRSHLPIFDTITDTIKDPLKQQSLEMHLEFLKNQEKLVKRTHYQAMEQIAPGIVDHNDNINLGVSGAGQHNTNAVGPSTENARLFGAQGDGFARKREQKQFVKKIMDQEPIYLDRNAGM